jgi:signal transduction histidine kinase/CheY-like chemotaxis protein
MGNDSPGSARPGDSVLRIAGAEASACRTAQELRVLLLAPTARDGQASRRLLEAAGIRCEVFPDMDRLCAALDGGAAAVVVPEEVVLADDGRLLAGVVARQPVWSDLPVIVLTRAGAAESPAVETALATLGNVSLIERPLRVSTLLSVLRTALRARERQYQVRDQLDQQRRHEEALRVARDAAEAANNAKDRFLAALSHELRTPLSPVTITLDSLACDDALPTRLREDVEMIRRNIDLETKLIDDLLDLSRVVNGKLRLQLAATSLHDLLRHVLEICAAELQSGEVEVRFDLRATSDRVLADPARLRQVFWNLIKNAIKFTPRSRDVNGARVSGGAVVVVRTSNPCPGRVVVEVCDEGVGIAAEVLPRVFDAFEQGDARRATQSGGLGLGLAISKAVVDMHGGRINARSAGPGCGSTFAVELSTVGAAAQNGAPAIHKPPVSAAAPGNGSPGAGGNGTPLPRAARVLLAEDHSDTAKVMVKLLRLSGYVVRSAGTVAEALELAAAEPFDVLVSDIGLPDASGYELMRQLKSRYGVRGIALSGYGMEEDARRSREAGFDDHIVKPVNVAQLRAAIARMAAAAVAAEPHR